MSYRLLEDGSSKRLLEDGTSKRLLEDGSGASSFKSAWAINRQHLINPLCDGMKKNVASQKVGAQLVSATDGSAFTGSVTVSVTGDAGTQATGSVGSGACTHEGNGYHTYAPAQAETNYDLIAFTFTGTGAVPVTVQVYTLPTTGVLAPATLGRTLVVDAAGLADANVVKLGPTGSGTAQTARDIGASVLLSSGTGTGQLDFTSGVVKANTTQFAGSAITSASGIPEVKLTNGAHGGAAAVLTLSRIIVSSATTNTPGVSITGNGTGVGMVVTGGASGGDGVQFTGGASGGIGFQCYGPAGTGASFAGVGSLMAGLSITSQTSDALVINGATGGTGVGIAVTGGATAGDAVQLTAGGGNSDALQLTGAGTGHALSAAGTVNVSGAATLASTLTVSGATTLTGAVTASNASNNIVGIDVAKISGDATAADNAESFFDGTGYAGTNNVIPLVTTTTTATNVTTVNGLASGVITATSIAADAIGASELAADAVAEIADAVWDELLSGHAISGSAGAGLSAAGSAGDPWSTALPGAYSAGTAGYILGTNLNATVTSRMATYTQPTGFLAATFPTTVASTTNITAGTITTVTNLTNAPTAGDFTATMKTSIGTAVAASAVASVTGNVGGNVTGSVGSVVGAVGSVTGNVGGNVTGSVGSISGVSFPSNFAALGINASGHVSRVTLADTITTYTGNTVQTGDAYAALTSAVPDTVPADGSRPTVQQAVRMILQSLIEGGISGTTWTVKKEDGSTTLMTVTLDSATTPTSKTRAS